MILSLPFPPPVNNLFATFRGRRIRSRRYEAWIAAAGAALIEQRPRPIYGPFHVTITVTRPDRRKRDLDGLAKAPLDLLVKHGIIEDDSKALSILLMWSTSEPIPGGAMSVLIGPDFFATLAVAA